MDIGMIGLRRASGGFPSGIATAALTILAMLGATTSRDASAVDDPLSVAEIVARVNGRLAGRSVSRKIEMTMTDRRGRTKQRRAGSLRKYDGDDLRSVIYYLSPEKVRGSAFLIHDYGDLSREDDQWFYLPALRRVRRVAASDRGDYFMGTDFTYDDVKHETDISGNDYLWRLDGSESIDTSECLILEGQPVDTATARSLGYSRIRVWIAKKNWIPLRSEYWDLQGSSLKTIRVSDIRQVDGVWTPHRIEAERHKNGHRTLFVITDTDFEAVLDDLLFAKRSLESIPAQIR